MGNRLISKDDSSIIIGMLVICAVIYMVTMAL